MSGSFGIYVRVASGLVVGNSLENSWVSRIQWRLVVSHCF